MIKEDDKLKTAAENLWVMLSNEECTCVEQDLFPATCETCKIMKEFKLDKREIL